MKLALIPPYERLTDTARTDYQLCLAHLLLESHAEYTNVYRTLCESESQYTILDNGAFEGSLVSNHQLMTLGELFNFDEVVIPDTIKDADATISRAQEFLRAFCSEAWKPKFMFVAQGDSRASFDRSIEWAINDSRIDTIALPKHMPRTLAWKSARIDYAYNIYHNSDKAVHLLGATPLWTEELEQAVAGGWIRGMDTSMPYVYGWHEQYWPSSVQYYRQHDYFNSKMDSAQSQIAQINVDWMVGTVYGH